MNGPARLASALDAGDGARAALVAGDKTWTYARLREDARAAAAALGDRRGARVGLRCADAAKFVPAFFGALLAGAAVVPLAAELPDAAAEALLDRAGCSAVLGDDGTRERAVAAGPGAPDPDEALVLFTSGTTGAPKGVVHSGEAVLANARAVAASLSLSPADRTSVFLPLTFSYGLSQMLSTFSAGGSVVAEPFFHPAFFVKRLRETGATGFGGVPSHLRLLSARGAERPHDLPSLRWVMNAGGPLEARELAAVRSAFPRAEVVCAYGCTEIGPRATQLPAARLADKAGSIGVAIAGVSAVVLDPAGRETAAGETGELVLSGPSLMKGYLGDPAATERALGPRGFRTGDLAARDADGFLWFKGRADDQFKSGGEKIDARAVELALLSHPAVAEAVVVPVPDAILGAAPKAVVVLKAGAAAGADELKAHARGLVPPSHVPKSFVFADALEKTPNGKVRRSAYAEARA